MYMYKVTDKFSCFHNFHGYVQINYKQLSLIDPHEVHSSRFGLFH